MRVLLVLLAILLVLATGRVTADTAVTTSTIDTASTQSVNHHGTVTEISATESGSEFDILFPLLFIAGASLVVWRGIESRRDVRLAMIEKGMNPSLSNETADESSKKFSALRFGMLLTGVGFGLLIAIMIVNFWPTVQYVEGIFIGSSLLYGGIGLMVYHVIARRTEK